MMLYCSAIEFKQKEIMFLQSNYCWTVQEIITLYVFVLTVKYAKEYWVSETSKITNKVQHVSVHEIDIQSRLAEKFVLNRASILLSNSIQSFFFHFQWIFELCQWGPPSICFWLPLWGPVDLQTEVVGLLTPNPAGYPKCSNLKDMDLENMKPVHQQLWSLECSVVETVASLLHGVTEHCLAGIQSHCLDKVDGIQAV